MPIGSVVNKVPEDAHCPLGSCESKDIEGPDEDGFYHCLTCGELFAAEEACLVHGPYPQENCQ
ncbi:hypothetical protein LCGC14_1054010 [marine sediment metagenome]|uniref:C2H2-type domain-containing protein n=1 Tax=marine sediment metagenome TaxID=412755 RepID=A0A0F9N9T2_9ZZZZ